MIFLVIIFGLPVLDLVFWHWADRRLRVLPRPLAWRLSLAAFMLVQLALYASFVVLRMMAVRTTTPPALIAGLYLWHLFILPATMLALSAGTIADGLIRFAKRGRRGTAQAARDDAVAPHVHAGLPDAGTVAPVSVTLTRRQLLAATAAAVPPLITVVTVPRTLQRLDEFRVRRIDVPLPTLPPALDGLTIAHVSDIHVGKFTRGKVLGRIVEATNNLRADVVAMTGDLIDFSLRDLPVGLDVLKRMDPRVGLWMCEGNHDLFEGREAFETIVRGSGVSLLLNEAADVEVRGERVQLLGLKWGLAAVRREPMLAGHMDALLPRRQRGAFQVLLAHHPHAFDWAADASIPLTLAGHTHGGQLMLTEEIGAGPAMFKYWSGLYREGNSALVVSNGVGNWFPLRINAPAEIVHLTLRRA